MDPTPPTAPGAAADLPPHPGLRGRWDRLRPRLRPRLLWDVFMVYLAILNVGLILFDFTYLWLRPVYLDHLPAVVEQYDPVKGITPLPAAEVGGAEPAFVRARGRDGDPVDRFWLLDLPFLLFFAAELFVRWGLAVRRRTYPRWYLFPLIHWYDVLGIVPSHEMRIFRLFRVVSIWVRLHRSPSTSIGDDLLSRTVRGVADAVSEEVADRVAVRILDLAQREIRAGALSRITRSALLPRRAEVREQIVERLADVLGDPRLHDRAGAFLRANLERAVDSSPALARIPLPRAVKEPLVRYVGEVVFDSVVETLTVTLRSGEGRAALDGLVDEVMEVFAGQLGRGEIEALIERTVLDLLQEMKGSVAEKRWMERLAAEPGDPPAPPQRE